jgi:aminoglycoside 3-N-acetyltransferase
MSFANRSLSIAKASVRSIIRGVLSQDRRTELKRLQGLTRKKLAPALELMYGSFTSADLIANLNRSLPSDFEILMVHSSFDTFLPMYKGTAKDLVNALIEFCGPDRTLAMPSFVMGGRSYDQGAYFESRPFNVRTTPSDMGLVAEIFRRTPKVLRGLHPTCGLCALGPLAKDLTTGHHVSKTGLSPDSPFGLMNRRSTAILGLGVEYYRCLTHVHTAPAAMGDEFPIKFAERSMNVTVVDYDGARYECKVGLPDRTKKLDLRVLWSVLSQDELVEWRFHGIPMFVIPKAGVLTARLVEAARRGITVYGRVPVHRDSLAAVQ